MNVTDPKKWGPPLWDILHYITFQYDVKDAKKIEKIFTYHILNLMPCKSCQIHYKQYISEHPINTSSRKELTKWLVYIHNKTNKQLGKNKMSYSKVINRYTTCTTQTRVLNSFLKWNDLMHSNIVNGNLSTQQSYSIFTSFIFNYV